MIIIGDDLIKFDPIYMINSKTQIIEALKKHSHTAPEEIANSPINLPLANTRLEAVLGFEFNKELIELVKQKQARMAIFCSNTTQILISNALKANLIIVPLEIAKEAMQLAEYYMFDSKIACVIDSLDEIAKLAKAGVDAAILKNAIIN